MFISIRWLEELLHIKIGLDTLKRVCLNLGLEVEEEFTFAPEGVVIGKINKLSPHPRLRTLSILDIKTDRKIQIVTAAQNIKQGDFVLVGPAGVTLHGQKIVEKDFAGITSHGILVSEQELGLVEESTGVIVLEKGKSGSLFKDIFDDVVVEMNTTPNRPDWLSVEGIARELAIGFDIGYPESTRPSRLRQYNRTGAYTVKIEDLHGCPRYTARIFENIVVKESPFWMKWRLHCMNMTVKNSVVDSTNLMMLLTGQPLHPFDLDLLKGGIIIRKARSGEEFITLEGTVLKLNKDDVVIADREGVIALAGIIGAKRAQISESTKRVLLESAYFNPQRIGHTARRLNLMTDASMRFERGADISIVDETSTKTGKLLRKYAKAKEVDFIGLGKKAKSKKVIFSLSRLNNILSLHLTATQVKSMLKKIDIRATGTEKLTATIPHYRRDVQIAEDIYEEVARIFGYMNIPDTLPKRWAGEALVDKHRVYEEAIRNYLVGLGFSETYNLSLVPSKRLADFGWEKFVRIKNPLNERFDALRPTLFFGLLDCVNYNRSKGNRSLKLFETGNIALIEPPYQEKKLAVIMGGQRYPGFWGQHKEEIDYFDAKGDVEALFDYLHLREVMFKPGMKNGFTQAVAILYSGQEIGYLGCIDKNLCEDPFFYWELALEPLWSFVSEPFYLPPARFPANTRDLSFLVNEKTQAPDVMNLIVKVGGPVLERVNLFDYYIGDNLPRGKKNLGFRLYFRAPDRTLTDKEVNSFIKKITEEIVGSFQAQLRTKEQSWTK